MDDLKRLNAMYEYLRSKGKIHTKKDLAEAIGANRVNVSKAFGGDEKYLTANLLNRVNSAFGNIFDPQWILTGEGNMLINNIEASPVPVEEQKGDYFTETHNGVKYYDLGNGNYRMVVKLVPHCAYARFINETNTLEPDKENWEEESFIVDKIAHGRYFAFEVKGDSMDDGTRASFEEGDRVLARELDRIHWKDGIRFNSYPYWVVSFGNSVLIKEVISQDLEQGTITFHSLNPSPEYSDFFLHMDEIRSLYYVVQKKPKTVKYNK